MGEDGASGESDRIDGGRRRALTLLGLWAAAALLAPVLIISRPAKAQGDGGDGGDGGDDGGHGDDDDDDDDEDGHGEGDLKGPSLPPEAP